MKLSALSTLVVNELKLGKVIYYWSTNPLLLTKLIGIEVPLKNS